MRELSPIGSSVLQVTATDLDETDTITYFLSQNPNQSFAIDSSTGVISTARMLYIEQQAEYILTVAANDGTYNVGTSVTVDILEVNRKVPFCTQHNFVYQVVENASTFTGIGNVSVTDLQSTSPNRDTFVRLRYPSHLIGARDNSLFLRTGVEFQRSGDSPSPVNTLHATVSAVDRGMPQLYSTCEAFVQILATNVYTPYFYAPSPSTAVTTYSVPIPSNAPIGYSLTAVYARLVHCYIILFFSS